MIALVAIVAAVIAAVFYFGQKESSEDLPGDEVNFTVSADNGVITLAKDGAEDATTAAVYEDFSCHYCAEMSVGGHADELAALNNGDMVVEYRLLNFLDGGAEGHSTRALAVMNRIAETGDAHLFWNFHTLLMRDQQGAASWDFADYADQIDKMGGDDELVDDVKDGLDMKAAATIGKANGENLKKTLDTDSVTSPHVVVDGKDILLNAPNGGLGEWVKLVLDAGK
nr:thioredoxin domain-containing protein [Corynebacterium sp. TAE3-ERU12]